MVAEDFNDAGVVGGHRKLETLVLSLLLFAVQHVHKLDELFTVDHLASVIVIDCAVLVIYD